ncbi:MAG: response regulator [Myxococcales bacterium]|nr:response regulator [Myxococcales bacterium]
MARTFVSASRSTSLPPSPGKPRIIVCDATVKMQRLLQAVLGEQYDCVPLQSGEEVLEVALAAVPDMIIAEIDLQGMSGMELCRQVKAEPRLESVPVILLTGVADGESRAIGLESGADEYLYKPLRPRELRARVASLLKLRFASQSLEARTLELESANRGLVQAQRALVQAEKLASIGTLVAGVAHEINNPLTFITAGVGALEELIGELAQLSEAVQAAVPEQREQARIELDATASESRQVLMEIADGARRLQRISSELKLMAPSQQMSFEEVDLAAEVRAAWKLANPGPGVAFVPKVDLPPLWSVGHMIGQVLSNLFTNAIHAMNGKGLVCCSATEGEGEVVVEVKDDGPGIAPQHLPRVFDPFFTTKPVGKGTGLGLSVSRALVQKLGGTIEVSSRPGAGATFTIRLPRTQKAASPESGELEAPPAAQPGCSEHARAQ